MEAPSVVETTMANSNARIAPARGSIPTLSPMSDSGSATHMASERASAEADNGLANIGLQPPPTGVRMGR